MSKYKMHLYHCVYLYFHATILMKQYSISFYAHLLQNILLFWISVFSTYHLSSIVHSATLKSERTGKKFLYFRLLLHLFSYVKLIPFVKAKKSNINRHQKKRDSFGAVFRICFISDGHFRKVNDWDGYVLSNLFSYIDVSLAVVNMYGIQRRAFDWIQLSHKYMSPANL